MVVYNAAIHTTIRYWMVVCFYRYRFAVTPHCPDPHIP